MVVARARSPHLNCSLCCNMYMVIGSWASLHIRAFAKKKREKRKEKKRKKERRGEESSAPVMVQRKERE